jgi:hypothetical protein
MSLALFIQRGKRRRRIIVSSVACMAIPRFSYYPLNGRILWEKIVVHEMYDLIFFKTSAWNASHSKQTLRMYRIYVWLLVMYSLISWDINPTSFIDRFSNHKQI